MSFRGTRNDDQSISRRTGLRSLPALGGLLLTGCSRDMFVPPRVRGGLIGAADVLTMSTNRLLLSANSWRESTAKRRRRPVPDLEPDQPAQRGYQRHLSEGFTNWRLPITGSSSVRTRCRSTRSGACLPARKSPPTCASRAGRRSANGPARRSSGCSTRRAASRLRRATSSSTPSMGGTGIRSVRGRASSDDPCLRTQRPRPSERQRRAAPSARRTAVRIQAPQVPEIDSGCRLDGRLWQRHGWNQLGLRIPLVRRRIERFCRERARERATRTACPP